MKPAPLRGSRAGCRFARALATCTLVTAALATLAAQPPAALAQGAGKHGAAPVPAEALPAGVSRGAIERMLEMQLPRGGTPDDALRARVVQLLRTRALFAREARAAGLADTPRVRAEIEIAINQILAQAYEERLRRDVAPTEAELRQRYGAMRDAATTGSAQVAWPSFDESRAALAQSIADERVARRLEALDRSSAAPAAPAATAASRPKR